MKLIKTMLLVLIISMCSCKALLYKKDACGNYPALKRTHRTEYNLSK